MAKKIAVAVLHGMGSFSPDEDDGPKGQGFSAELKANVRDAYGKKKFDGDVAWREVLYADILDANQTRFKKALGNQVYMTASRKFVIRNLGDPASFAVDPKDNANTIYLAIQKRIFDALAALEKAVEPDGPLVVLAHSLGGHVIANYIWDHRAKSKAGMTGMKQTAALVTFGCNIPLFLFAFAPKDILTAPFPGTGIAEDKRLKPWWVNWVIRGDPLGFPLQPIGGDYAKMGKNGELADILVDDGAGIPWFDLLNHDNYWRSTALAAKVAEILGKAV